MKAKKLKGLIADIPDNARIYSSPHIAGVLLVTTNDGILLAAIDVGKSKFDVPRKPYKKAAAPVQKQHKLDPNFFKKPDKEESNEKRI